MVGRRKAKRLLSDRLLQALTQELATLEAKRSSRRKGSGDGEAASEAPPRSADAKARIEAIGQLTRSLEKLLELRQIETLGLTAEAEGDDAETERLRGEMLKRLRALDARRAAGGAWGEALAAGGAA